jgi:hypothetical protein
MLIDSLVEDFANLEPYEYLPHDYSIWYVGTETSIETAIDALLTNLNKHGHVIIGNLETIDYIYEGKQKDLIYIILYRSLPKLEYLEYKSKEKEDKNAII